ncbi:MAG TPA: hypothetical protein VKW04_18205 [Planctomycetota bacterium]|nr:hypothetical protein [Planctomycetota bacterium]
MGTVSQWASFITEWVLFFVFWKGLGMWWLWAFLLAMSIAMGLYFVLGGSLANLPGSEAASS